MVKHVFERGVAGKASSKVRDHGYQEKAGRSVVTGKKILWREVKRPKYEPKESEAPINPPKGLKTCGKACDASCKVSLRNKRLGVKKKQRLPRKDRRDIVTDANRRRIKFRTRFDYLGRMVNPFK